ncbi:hypothetical protein D9M71_783550 [compost metagenome]
MSLGVLRQFAPGGNVTFAVLLAHVLAGVRCHVVRVLEERRQDYLVVMVVAKVLAHVVQHQRLDATRVSAAVSDWGEFMFGFHM